MCAFYCDSDKSITAFTNACVQAFVREKINISQLMDLLSAEDKESTPGLYYALSHGRSSAVFAFIYSLINLLKQGKLSLSQGMRLIAAKKQGCLGIEAAVDPHTIKVYYQLLRRVCQESEELASFWEAFSSSDESAHFLSTMVKKIQQHLSQAE